ncbi:hypothetical protein MMC12_005953 [Toensbergia leucococca]|nr:hypothetical protein [Toensbergia leucococca]
MHFTKISFAVLALLVTTQALPIINAPESSITGRDVNTEAKRADDGDEIWSQRRAAITERDVNTEAKRADDGDEIWSQRRATIPVRDIKTEAKRADDGDEIWSQ